MPEAASNEWTVEWYRTAAGEIPAKAFLARLTGRPKDEALALLELAQRRGNRMREPKAQALGGGLFELRGDQVRLFLRVPARSDNPDFGWHGEEARQDTERRDKAAARNAAGAGDGRCQGQG